MHQDDVQSTAITTLFGLIEFPFMSFGLRNATQTFQRFIDEIRLLLRLQRRYPGFLKFATGALANLQDNLHPAAGLRDPAQTRKMHFSGRGSYIPRVKNLGQGLTDATRRDGRPTGLPAPKTTRHLRRYLGMLNFYRRFVPHTAVMQAPLHALLAGPCTKSS